MTLKKVDWINQIGNALAEEFGMAMTIDVTGYIQDGSNATIDFDVSVNVNGDIEDLPSGYRKGDLDSEYIVSILSSKKKIDWKEFDNVHKELRQKGWNIQWKAYYKDQEITEEDQWNIAPKEFTYKIVNACHL